MVCGGWLLVEHIGGVADVTGLEGGYEGGEVKEFAAAGVDDHGSLGKQGQATGVEQALGFGGELGVEGDEVRLAKGFVEGFCAFEAVPAGEVLFPIVGKHHDAQAEGAGADGDLLGDAAEADEHEGFAADFVAGDAGPATGGDVIGFDDQVTHGGEEQGEGVLGYRGVIDAGGEEYGQAEILGGGEVDFVQADAVFGDDL